MQHEFSFPFDVPFIAAATRRRVARRGLLFAAFALGMLGLHALGTRTFSLPLTLVVLGTVALVSLRLYFAWRVGARRLDRLWAIQSPERRFTWRLDERGLQVLLGAQEEGARFAWSDLGRLSRHPDVWTLEVAKAFGLFFPPRVAPDAAREFLLERCREAGVRGA